jgi:hypothetical protein
VEQQEPAIRDAADKRPHSGLVDKILAAQAIDPGQELRAYSEAWGDVSRLEEQIATSYDEDISALTVIQKAERREAQRGAVAAAIKSGDEARTRVLMDRYKIGIHDDAQPDRNDMPKKDKTALSQMLSPELLEKLCSLATQPWRAP